MTGGPCRRSCLAYGSASSASSEHGGMRTLVCFMFSRENSKGSGIGTGKLRQSLVP